MMDDQNILLSGMVAEREYVLAAEGDDREILCTAYSKQNATIFWRKTVDGVVTDITNNSSPVENTQQFVSQSILKLTNAKINDSSNSIECWFIPDGGEEKYDTITLDVIGKSGEYTYLKSHKICKLFSILFENNFTNLLANNDSFYDQ